MGIRTEVDFKVPFERTKPCEKTWELGLDFLGFHHDLISFTEQTKGFFDFFRALAQTLSAVVFFLPAVVADCICS